MYSMQIINKSKFYHLRKHRIFFKKNKQQNKGKLFYKKWESPSITALLYFFAEYFASVEILNVNNKQKKVLSVKKTQDFFQEELTTKQMIIVLQYKRIISCLCSTLFFFRRFGKCWNFERTFRMHYHRSSCGRGGWSQCDPYIQQWTPQLWWIWKCLRSKMLSIYQTE